MLEMRCACRSVFLAEVLAKGEVPRDARSIWKQRSRWAAAAHMYILDPSSVFWRKQPHMSFWQKSLYWIPMVLHWTLIWSEPVMFTMPLMCLVLNICPYGIDPLLWFTHFAKLVTTVCISSYADTLELSRAAIYGQTMARVLFFVNVKAVINTIMVYTGWKRPGAFKVTVKAGGAKPNPAGEAKPAEAKPAEKAVEEEVERDNGGPMIPVRELPTPPPAPAHNLRVRKHATLFSACCACCACCAVGEERLGAMMACAVQRVLKGLKLYKIHDAISKVTELRKKVMPWEGTFDFWVLLGITLMNLFAVTVGFIRLGNKSAIISVRGCENENVQLIALVFGFIEAVPGLLFIMCAVHAPGLHVRALSEAMAPFALLLGSQAAGPHVSSRGVPSAAALGRAGKVLLFWGAQLSDGDDAAVVVQVHGSAGARRVGHEDLGATPHRLGLNRVHPYRVPGRPPVRRATHRQP